MSDRSLPGGYAQVAVPVFKNFTQEVGIEPYFTNALIRQISRSRVARVGDKETSPLVLEGIIRKVDTIEGAKVTGSAGGIQLPEDAVLTTEFRILVSAELILRRRSDEKVIWRGSFQNEKVYAAPRIGHDLVNSANATYNQSARMDTIARLAEEMMLEAHDRMTENF